MSTSQATKPTSSSTSSFFSSFTSSLTSNKTAADFGKRFNVLSQTLQQNVRDLPKNLSRLPDHLDSEHEQFVNSKTGDEKQQRSEFVMPWEGYGTYEPELKRRILEITKDERNFLIPPPDDTTFEFDLKAYSQSARAILTQDKALPHMRFILVPQQLNEDTFWRNYFYRVVTVKKAVLSDTPSADPIPTSHNDEKEKDDVLFDFAVDTDDDDDEGDKGTVAAGKADQKQPEENVSTPLQKSTDLTKADTRDQVAVEGDDEMEEWERELRRAAAEGL
ncbi:hypothetical protein [Absidia glauca]|uniref:BSD domain-containing protein n=1 Tax=Absidia glauca TaxID=4829 RepID=A0A163K8Y8_ABSGL|nr:hypothetical protein [Absidia glauca]